MLLPIKYERVKKLDHVSPSQIKTFRRCARRWYYEKLVGLRPPPTAALQRGTDLHTCVEHRIMHGEYKGTDDIVAIAQAGEAYLDNIAANFKRGDVLIECKVDLTEGLALPLTGRADVVDLADHKVIDHKTTSNFRWCVPPFQLRTDVQALSYVMWAKTAQQMKMPVEFQHIYYRTRGKPAVKETTVSISSAGLDSGWKSLCQTVDTMAENALVQHAGDVQPNASACKDYGGCPFVMHCEGLGDVVSGPARPQEVREMDWKAKLKARKEEQAGPAKSPNPPDGEPLTQAVKTPVKKKRKAKAAPAVQTLYIGCLPRKVEVTYLTDVLKPLQQQVAEMNSLTHYGLLEYGKGKTMVVALLAEQMLNGSLPEHLVADRRNPCTDACLEVLTPLYSRVVERIG